ncbi:hypothetical protein GOBAR_AA11158 [Gossypium barbadense]|uniref:DM2 domain-containing protein n=1 Tax=Gossypium barbadense TaxID=3634 RepID=A0A2P5Y1N4_GOSBA|nr:hypothetical protein GOBAR_AA11158 [Gossypium barbadense]
MVSDQEIARGVEILLRQSEPNAVTTLNGVVQQLEAKLGLDLSHKAGFIRDHISLLLRSHPTTPKDHFTLQQQHTHFRQHPQSHSRAPFTAQPPPPLVQPQQQQLQAVVTKGQVNATTVAATEVLKEAPVGTKRRGGPGGLNKVCSVSPALQVIVGEPALPRTEIVKQLWAYIRKNSLQDPSNKRKIICDDALRLVFETDCTDMFKMNKLLAKHITAFEPSKESSQTKRAQADAEPKTESVELSDNPVVISEALAKFLDAEGREMQATEAERRVWEYIKLNHLEDPSNSMVVLCDAKLRELLGCESISVMGIHDSLQRHHLLKPS